MLVKGLGLTWDHVDGPLKYEPIDWLDGTTPRHLLQTLGTEWGRHQHPEMWLRLWRQRYGDLCRFPFRTIPAPAGTRGLDRKVPVVGVIVDDVRFVNEAEFLQTRCHDFQLLSVVRAKEAGHPTDRHVSETQFDLLIQLSNNIVVNKGGLDAFREAVMQGLRRD